MTQTAGGERDTVLWNEIFLNGNSTAEERQTAYFAERLERIKQGLGVWMVANFDSDSGIAAYYYRDGKQLGVVDTEWDGLFDAAVFESATEAEKSVGRVGLSEAIDFVEQQA